MLPLSETAEALLRYVCDHPEDHTAKLVLADCLEEDGNELCEGFRELAKEEAIPHDNGLGWYPDAELHRDDESNDLIGFGKARLPTDVYFCLPVAHRTVWGCRENGFANRDYFLAGAQAYVDAAKAKRKEAKRK